jgi:hypothetical protein
MGSKFQIAQFDITLPSDKNEFDTVRDVFKQWCKKWAFQQERGDSGYVHWQCRISLIKKRRLQEILPKMKEAGLVFGKMSPLHEGGDIYALKADTRVAGPWTDQDKEPAKLTRQIKPLEDGLYLWQQKILAMMKMPDNRHIEVLYCEHGNTGKSAFVEWCEFKGYCEEIPMMRLMQEIMQCVFALQSKCYAIDMPRAMKKEKLFDFYSGIECIKNGLSYDQRYSFKKRRQDRPNVWIMTNSIPDRSLMSRDRWRIWTVTEKQDLVPFNFEKVTVKKTDESLNLE